MPGEGPCSGRTSPCERRCLRASSSARLICSAGSNAGATFNPEVLNEYPPEFQPLSQYDQAIKLDARNVVAWNNRCGRRYRQDTLDAAIADCNRAIKAAGGCTQVAQSFVNQVFQHFSAPHFSV